MPPVLKYVIDGLAGIALIFALLLVFVVDRLMKPSPATAGKNTLEIHDIIDAPKATVQKTFKLAVTPSGAPNEKGEKEIWDDMGKLLAQMGDIYKFDVITPQQILRTPSVLLGKDGADQNAYNVLFLTCAPRKEVIEEVLRSFVERGGILYASDWRYEDVAKAFPDMVDPSTRGEGNETLNGELLTADVVDPALRDVLGKKQIHLKFDLGRWKTAAFAGPRVQTLIKGTYPKYAKKLPSAGGPPLQYAVAPLLVKFSYGNKGGTVIFTSFHNEKQNSEDETKLLKYLVFSLMTANVDAEVAGDLEKLGFTPQRANLLSTAKENPSVTKTYENPQNGTLRFTLGIPTSGAKLRFNLKSPEKLEYTKDVEATFSFEVPDAKAGTWTYTVTALEGTPENFPFTVTIAKKQQ